MIIRKEIDADIQAINDVTVSAFETLAVSSQTEHFIIKALRAADALILSLVAEQEGTVVGHIAFSPVTLSDETKDWYALGPVSVLPEYQKQGIGTALINEGLFTLKKQGAKGCALVGDPEYYRRFGFMNPPGLVFEGIPPEVFLVLPFNVKIPQGTIVFHQAFLAQE